MNEVDNTQVKPVKKTPIKELKEPSYGDKLKLKLADARKSDKIAGLSDDEKDKAFELLEAMVAQLDRAHTPSISNDFIIDMDLMKGGHITLIEPTGHHTMQAKRAMQLYGKTGDIGELINVYTMVCCATIDDKPMAIHDVERLHAHDFNVLLEFFCRINLL